MGLKESLRSEHISACQPKFLNSGFYRSFLFCVILLRMTEMQCVVSGVVQGVAYRAYVQESATALELVGYVKNQSNGTVEVVAQGMPDVLKEFVEYLHEGSLMAKVESVAVEWASPQQTFTEFSVLH